jgi:L-iditol 2-dehydrogenase
MMKAVIVAPDRFEVRQAPRPTLRAPDELLLRTAACGICSGDLMPWYLAKKVGTVLGHEVVGYAAEVGPAVTGIRPGDLVFAHHHAPCLHCPDCARGAFVHCATWKASALDPGGMAEWIRVPDTIASADCFAVNDLTPEQALFIEPLGCCVKAFARAGMASPLASAAGGVPTVTVVGCGVMGLLNLQVARALGAGRLLAIEPDSARRAVAGRIGAEALSPGVDARGIAHQADLVVIGPGAPEVIVQALGYVRPGGSALLFTPTSSGALTSLDLGELYFREVSLVPSYSCGPADTRRAYELLRSGQVDPVPLITHRFDLADVQTAYDTARAGGPAIKVVVTFGS